ncbi:prepilin-type N-terminal cleavage/methylation domain-containing protein [Pseudidiomarina woesei]|uniref:Prepilin-type N-terminal cleavage/methylation domain n=1 Tax=Pseudidiomarina woesei TaxID=1381080 RepID=A0A0K6H7Q8_9GAMM|nr:prepilin-type N-terminal cleavage/methylation domain-containing protein [Pseudidiomarina woesei]CUA87026.1 prepilin-type N-terminal cleavage/methylation domain [Pseudidiomarina woesei]
MKTQKGFTLIELIIVIVVLGILAVTAAPQFFNFAGDARLSQIKGVEGAINSAAQIVYGKSAIESEIGLSRSDTPTPAVDSIPTSYGYPTATVAGIVTAANINVAPDNTSLAGDFVFTRDTSGPQDMIYIAPAALIDATGYGITEVTATNCYLQYIEASGPASNQGYTLTVVTTGCNS